MLIEFNLPEFCKDNCPKFTPLCETISMYRDGKLGETVVAKKCENADICKCAVENYVDYFHSLIYGKKEDEDV